MKRIKRKINITFLMIILINLIIFPVNTGATTLKEYEDQVAKYTEELNSKKNQIVKSKQEIEQIKTKIQNIKGQIQDCANQMNELQDEIDKSNEEIIQKQKEIKSIIKYYQLSNSGNAYLEYILGADSITDMIYRLAVSEQMTNYNKRVTKELNELIEKNNQKKADLDVKQKELGKLNSSLYEEQQKIEEDIISVEGTMPSTTNQLAYYQKRVAYYKAKGCKSNDVIGVTCDVPIKVSTGSGGAGNVVAANGFRFPVPGGKVTQNYGNNGHKGADIGRYCGAPIYAVANGTVYYVGNEKDIYGAKMVLVVHNVNGRLVFSQYAHLSGYNVSEGQTVTTNTVIGYMGDTGYSFGCHLHLEMSEYIGWDYPDVGNYQRYVGYIINPFKYVPR